MPEEEGNSNETPLIPQSIESQKTSLQSPSSSSQLALPTMQQQQHQQMTGRQASPNANPTPSGRHSHARSKSVNLSPTMGAAGTPFAPGMLRWDDLASPSSSSSGSIASSSSINNALLAPAARIGSPHLGPSSPLHINVQAASPSSHDFLRYSPGFAGSESDSSEGSSPDHRRRSSFARAMERSSSGGSLGASGAHHFMSQSPRSPFRRTASPSRAYAVPLSPRLQAFGSQNHTHSRKLSGGNLSHLSNDFLPRATSPMTSEVDQDLPIDSIWPSSPGTESSAPPLSPRSEAIPIGLSKTQTTPIPPSLRDDLLYNINLLDGSSSPNAHRTSTSPQDQYHHATFVDQRTPSPLFGSGSSRGGPSTSTSRREKRSSGSPAPYSPSAKSRPHSLPSMPVLAAPRAISKRAAFNLDGSLSTHSRTLSDSSSGSFEGLSDSDVIDQRTPSPNDDTSPAQKALIPPLGAQVKVNAQNVSGEVPASHSKDEQSHEKNDVDLSSLRRSPGIVEATQSTPSSSSMTSLDSTKAIASAHGIAWPSHAGGTPPLEGHFVAPRKNSLTALNGRVNLVPDGSILRARSPALGSPRVDSASLGDSPHKVRSFIGMPPRSGYDLSDDPDDVGSEDGSTGSGRESINEDREDNDDSDNDDNDAQFNLSESGDDVEDGQGKATEQAQGDIEGESGKAQTALHRPSPAPRRPSLGRSVVVYPSSLNNQGNDTSNVLQSDSHSMTWKVAAEEEEQTIRPIQKRADLQLTRDEGVDDDEESDESDENEVRPDSTDLQSQDGAAASSADESLNTLERIFLFAKSEMTYHRILVSLSLSEWILEVELSEAVEFVIPLLNGLACDENEVCIAFAPHLHQVMWHFFRNCPLVEQTRSMTSIDKSENQRNSETPAEGEVEKATRPRISVGVFTPLLCALLLNYNASIASATQTSLVRFFAHLQGFDFANVDSLGHGNVPEEEQVPQQALQFSSGKAQSKVAFDMNTALIRDAAAREEKRVALEEYEFGVESRGMIMEELLHHVALAIGNLNFEQATQAREMNSLTQEEEETPEEAKAAQTEEGNEGRMQSEEEDDDHDHADAVMDDIPLTMGEVEEGDDTNIDDEQSQSQMIANAFHDADDTEMMEEDHEQMVGEASQDNMSTVMSDVEEEVAVGRMASISLLAALGAEEVISRDFLINHIVPEMLRFSTDHTFFVRKEVAVAMGALAKCIGAELFQQANLLTIFETFCQDRIWHVRQAACLSLPNVFAQVQDHSIKRRKVIDIMRIFVADVSRNVRVAALDVIGEMIYLFHQDDQGVPQELVRHFLGEPYDPISLTTMINEVDKKGNEDQMDDSSFSNSTFDDRNGRPLDDHVETAPDQHFGWGGLTRSISTHDANGPNGWNSGNSYNHVSSFPGSLHGNNFMDPDRPLVMAYNFPAVMLTLGSSHWSKLKPVHLQLCSNPSPKVRRSLAASLHEIAKIIGMEIATMDLVDLFHRFLDSQMEKDEQVKMAMLEHLDEFLASVNLSTSLKCLQHLLIVWNESPNRDPSRFANNWRLREKLISLIPDLANRFLLQDDDGVLVILMQSAIVDAVSSVRWQGIKVVGSLYRIFEESDQVLADGFMGMLVDVGDNESYRGRVACIHCLAELCKNHLQRSSVEMLILNRLSILSKDSVIDVRLALAHLVALLCSKVELYAMPQSRSDIFVDLLQRLCHDESSLVRDVILAVLSQDDPARLSSREMIEQEQRPSRMLTLGPSDGGPHRPPVSQQSYLEDDLEGGVSTFSMDADIDEDENSPSKESFERNTDPTFEKDGKQQGSLGYTLDGDRDSSMFEDANDGDEGNRLIGRRRQIELNGLHHDAFTNNNNQDDMIVIPNHDNFLMLSSNTHDGNGDLSTQTRGGDSIGDDSLESEEPHHLLSIANDDDDDDHVNINHVPEKRAAESSPEQNRRHPSSASHGLYLESPERPWMQSSSSSHNNDNLNIDDESDHQGNEQSVNRSKEEKEAEGGMKGMRKSAGDPFLAFVADKRFDYTSGEE